MVQNNSFSNTGPKNRLMSFLRLVFTGDGVGVGVIVGVIVGVVVVVVSASDQVKIEHRSRKRSQNGSIFF